MGESMGQATHRPPAVALCLRRKRVSRAGGFTLIELMIVVAIIGIMATMGLTTFARYTVRAKQSEVRINLTSIYTAQLTYFTEHNHFTQYFTDPATGDPVLDFAIQGTRQFYTYDMFGAPSADGTLPGEQLVLPHPCAPDWSGTLLTFTVIAYANVDNDAAIDTWVMDMSKTPAPCHNDFNEIN